MMWTDPPYGVEYVGKTKRALTIEGDGAEGLSALLRESFALATEALAPGAPIYVAHPPGARSLDFVQAFVAAGWRLHQGLVWAKNTIVLGHSDYHYAHEPILYGYTPGAGRPGRGDHAGSRWYGDNSQSSLLTYDKPPSSTEHPTGKPVGLVEQCVSNSTRPGDVVLDPFAGSGSTLIACENLHRRCYAMEIDPGYCDVIVDRWERHTNRTATLAEA
jgi:DNA modification methylase